MLAIQSILRFGNADNLYYQGCILSMRMTAAPATSKSATLSRTCLPAVLCSPCVLPEPNRLPSLTMGLEQAAIGYPQSRESLRRLSRVHTISPVSACTGLSAVDAQLRPVGTGCVIKSMDISTHPSRKQKMSEKPLPQLICTLWSTFVCISVFRCSCRVF